MSLLGKEEMVLYEKVDLEALQIIRDNFDYLYDKGKLGRFVDAKNGYSVIQDKKVVYDMLCEFFNSRKKSEKQKYKYASGISWGRMFSDGVSLQGISRVIRQTIARQIYWDIDISNAHPVILHTYCVKNKIEVPTLTRYIQHRDELLADIIGLIDSETGKPLTRDDAKTIPLAIINGGKRSHLFKQGCLPDWVKLLEREIVDIYNFFVKTDIGKKFHRRAVSKKDRNVEGSTLNYFLCQQENEILCAMYRYLVEAGVRVGVFCFDGMMVYKSFDENGVALPFKQKLLEGAEEVVRDTLGYPIKLVVKEMTEFTSLEGLEKHPDVDVSDEGCAKYIYDAIDVLYHSTRKELFVYDEKTKLWVNTERESLRNVIADTLTVYFENIKDEDEKQEAIFKAKNCAKQSSVLTRLWALIIGNPRDEFITDNLDKKKGLFPISEGRVVDLRTETPTVRQRVKTDYFTRETEREFLLEPEVAFVRQYLAEVLTTKNSKYVDCILFLMGYCLTGENNLKIFIALLGEKDTGKTLFEKLMGLMMGSFAGAVSDKVFKQSKAQSVHDTEAFSLIKKRLAFVSELDENDKFNEQLMKKITGGDDVELRACGSSENVVVKFMSVLLCAMNVMPKFKEQAFAGRMRVISFKTKFENNPTRRDEILAHVDDFFTVACMYASKYYANGMQIEMVDEVLQSTQSVIDERDTFKTWLSDDTLVIDEEYKGKCPPLSPLESRMKKTAIYANYQNWCQANSLDAVGRNKFYDKFQAEFNLPTYNGNQVLRGVREKGFNDV